MKSHVMTMILALGTVSLSGTALHAQGYELAANVPFAFQVANQTFEPGKYIVRRAFEGAASLRTVANGHSIFIAGAYPALTGKAPGKLVFHCYGGDKCFLAEIWPGSGAGSEVPKSRVEKGLINSDPSREMATIAVDLRRAD
jgi:hypothetical protein